MFNETAVACALHLFLFISIAVLLGGGSLTRLLLFFSLLDFCSAWLASQHFAVSWLICCALLLLASAFSFQFVKLTCLQFAVSFIKPQRVYIQLSIYQLNKSEISMIQFVFQWDLIFRAALFSVTLLIFVKTASNCTQSAFVCGTLWQL